MITKEINGTKFKLHDSIEEMPITVFQKYNSSVLVDSNIGGDISSVVNKINNVLRFLEGDKKDKARQELLNMRQAMFFIVEGTSPEMKTFISLVDSIGGKSVQGMTDAEIEELIKESVKVGELRSLLGEVKKKLIQNLKSFFQSWRTMPKRKNTILD